MSQDVEVRVLSAAHWSSSLCQRTNGASCGIGVIILLMNPSADIMLVHQGKVLLQKRDNNPNIVYPQHWCLPGGRGKDGEEPVETIIRQFQIETDYVLKDPQLVLKDQHLRTGDGMSDRYLFHEIYDGVSPINCHEGEKFEFIAPADFDKISFECGIS